MYRYCFEKVIVFSLDIYPAVELLDHMVTQFLIFRGNSLQLFSIVAVPIYIPINSSQVFPFLYLLPNTCYLLIFFDGSHSNRCEISLVLICISLIMHFLCMISDGQHLFMYLLTICMSSLINVFPGSWPIFKFDNLLFLY